MPGPAPMSHGGGPSRSPMSRPQGGPSTRPGGMGGSPGARPGMGGGVPSRPGGMGAPGAGLGARRDITEKKEKIIYFSQMNFDQTSNDYALVKVTFGTLAFLVLLTVAAVLLNWGLNSFIGLAIAYAFWLFYFISSLVRYPKMTFLPYKDKKNYWTYELTEEYKQRNVALNDFKKAIAQELLRGDNTVLVDDVSVELMSYDPLIFDFSIRSRIKKDMIKNTVPQWGSKFDCEDGTLTSTGINMWRVVYARQSKWATLAGRRISPNDAIGETREASISYNPVGIRTDTYNEMHITNVDEHTIITGDPGYGKSNTFNLLLGNQFSSDAMILFFDKKEVEALAVNDRVYAVITYEQAEAWRVSLMEEMSRRSKLLAKNGKAKLLPADAAVNDPDAMPFTDDMPPIIVAIDECAMWISNSGGKQATDFRTFLSEIARVGRYAGVTLLVGSQSPRDTDIPDMVKRAASQFIAYKQNSETEQYAVHGEAKPMQASEARPSEIPLKAPEGGGGVGQFAFASSATDNLSVPVKAYFTSKDKVIKMSRESKSKKNTRLRIVERAAVRYEKIKEGYIAKHGSLENLPVSLIDSRPQD